jgi:hypothetical protein
MKPRDAAPGSPSTNMLRKKKNSAAPPTPTISATMPMTIRLSKKISG